MILEDLLADKVVESYSVRLPSYVNVSKKNVKAINLNIYRNLHHYHLSTQKKNFADDVKPLLRDKPRAEKIWIHYTIFASRNGTLDTMNVGSVADKYFSDTMVEAGKIPDDSQEHVVLITFSFGGVCPMDGHTIATVNILQKEPEDMRILLDQEDIQAALNAYVKTLSIPNAEDATVDLSVEDDEIVAEINTGKAPVKNKGGRPRKKPGPKPKPKTEEDSDAEDTADSGDEGSGSDSDTGGSDTEASDAEAGTEETPESEDDAKPETNESKGKTDKGNLFGDEESPSSDSAAKETTESGPTKGTTKVVKPAGKKSSIFDVD